MLEHLFYFTDFRLFLSSLGSLTLLSALAWLLMWAMDKVWRRPRGEVFTNTMLSGILLPSGMVLAFVAADVWQEERRGREAVEIEAMALSDALRVARHLPPEHASQAVELIYEYVSLAVEEEWPLMESGQHSRALELVSERLIRLAIETEAMEGEGISVTVRAAGQELRRYATELEAARDRRLRIADSRVRTPKWLSLYVLLFASACVIVELHLHTRRAMLLALALFILGFGTTVFMVASYDRPFSGRTAIAPIPLIQAQTRVVQN